MTRQGRVQERRGRRREGDGELRERDRDRGAREDGPPGRRQLLGKKDEAIDLADSSFKITVDLLGGLDEAPYSEATIILQLLKDKVALWNEESKRYSFGPHNFVMFIQDFLTRAV
jgi:hypothetical protein